MKLSKKGRYGIRALIDLAVYSEKGQIPINEIAERNQISQQYLEQVFASLKRGGIIKSTKGPQGGYRLNHPAQEITVEHILEVLEGGYQLAAEDVEEDSEGFETSHTLQTVLIDGVNKQLEKFLKTLTLDSLVQDYLKTSKKIDEMYYI